MNKVVPQIDNIFDYFCKAKYIVDLHESGDKRKLVEKELNMRISIRNRFNERYKQKLKELNINGMMEKIVIIDTLLFLRIWF